MVALPVPRGATATRASLDSTHPGKSKMALVAGAPACFSLARGCMGKILFFISSFQILGDPAVAAVPPCLEIFVPLPLHGVECDAEPRG